MNTVNLINMLFFLQKICITVEISERSVEKLLAEVNQLKEEIKRKKQQNSSGKLTKCDASLALPELTQVTEAENTSEPEAPKTVVQQVLNSDFVLFPQDRTKTTHQSQRRMFSFVRHCEHFSPIPDFRHALFLSKANWYPRTAVT